MRLDNVWKWWGRLRVGLSKKFAARGVIVRPLPYDELSEEEQEVVYNYWVTRQFPTMVRG
jgi:hypothetical protein